MTAQGLFQRVEAVFHELEALQGSEREQRLRALEKDDISVYRELRSLLQVTQGVTQCEQGLDALADAIRAQARRKREGTPSA